MSCCIMWGPKAPHRFSGAPPPYPGVSGVSPPDPDLLFSREKSRQKHAREEKPFRWGFSPVTPSSATTQRGARVGTSSASLILTQASGFARCAAPPSSSANAPLVCLGAAPAGPYFTDSRWINPVRRWKRLAEFGGAGGESKEGAAAPSLVVVGVGSIREGPHRKGPSLMRLFGHFFGVEKVTRGTGAEPPQKSRVWAGEAQDLRGTGPEAPISSGSQKFREEGKTPPPAPGEIKDQMYPSAHSNSARSTAPPAAPRRVLWLRQTNL